MTSPWKVLLRRPAALLLAVASSVFLAATLATTGTANAAQTPPQGSPSSSFAPSPFVPPSNDALLKQGVVAPGVSYTLPASQAKNSTCAPAEKGQSACTQPAQFPKPTPDEARRSADAIRGLLTNTKAQLSGEVAPLDQDSSYLNCVYLAFNDNGASTQEFSGNRFDSCHMQHWLSVVYTNGKATSTLGYSTFISQALSNNSTTWSTRFLVQVIAGSVSGTAQSLSFRASTLGPMNGGCHEITGLTPSLILAPSLGVSEDAAYWGVRCPVATGAVVNAGQESVSYGLVLDNVVGPLPETVAVSSNQQVRCDNVRGNIGAGCVLPKTGGVIEFDRSNANNGPAAVGYLNWQVAFPDHRGYNGPYGVYTPLTYLGDSTRQNQNRTAACRGFVATIPNGSCDEYPFASTYEGAAAPGSSYGVTYGRTEVTSSVNSSAGGVLGGGYTSQHILDGDKFWAKIL